MKGLRLWLGRSAFINSRRGFCLGLAALSFPCFVAAAQGHLQFFLTPHVRQDGVPIALLGTVLLFVVGNMAFGFLKSTSSALGRTAGACLVRFAILVAAEVCFVFFAHFVLYFIMIPFPFADGPEFTNWEKAVSDLFVPALVIMVLWTEAYFGMLSPPTKV